MNHQNKTYFGYKDSTTEPAPRTFYFGIGDANRVKDLRRNKKHVAIARRFGIKREVIIETQDYVLVNEWESRQIKEQKTFTTNFHVSDDDFGCNFTLGGDGTRGFKMKDSSKKKMSIAKKGIPSKGGKIVIQFNMQNNVIAIYQSADHAHMMCYEGDRKESNQCTGKQLRCCQGKNNSWRGFKWLYAHLTDFQGLVIDNGKFLSDHHLKTMRTHEVAGNKPTVLSRSVVQLDHNNALVTIHPTMRSAIEKLNLTTSNVTQCCKQQRQKAGGFRWMYLEDYENSLLSKVTTNT